MGVRDNPLTAAGVADLLAGRALERTALHVDAELINDPALVPSRRLACSDGTRRVPTTLRTVVT